MPELPDMTTPITRADLMEVLDLWGGALREQMVSMEAATKQDLADLAIRQDLFETTLRQDLVGMERRLSAELAQHTRSSATDVQGQIAVIDEKYADLPGRVARLEAKRPTRGSRRGG